MGGTNEASVLEGKIESLASLEPLGKAKSTWQASESATAAEKALHAEWLKTGGSNQTSLSDPTPMLQIPQGQVVYIIGGMGQEAGQKNQLCSVEQYDNQKQRFVEYGSMTARRLAAAACYLSGHGLMVCGGFDGTHHLASVELLNTTTRQWEQQAPMPKARTFAGLCTAKGKLYVVGGLTDQGVTNNVVCFDPSQGNGTWTEMPAMKCPRLGPGVAAMGDSLYVVGGATEHGKVLHSAEAFDLTTNTWSDITSMKVGRGAPGVAVIDNKMYVIGGCNDNGDATNEVEILEVRQANIIDAAGDGEITVRNDLQWKAGPAMPTSRAGLACCASVSASTKAIVALGGCGSGKQFLDTVEWLDPNTEKWHTAPSLNIARRYPAVVIARA